MRGFSRFFHEKDKKGRTVIVQTLPTADLKTENDSIIWFSFKDEEPTEVTFWLRFASPATVPSGFVEVLSVLDPAPQIEN